MKIDTSPDTLRDVLRRHGLHVTGARIAVLQVLAEKHHHCSVEDLRAEILERYPAIDPTTVYRALETLEDHGLTVRMDLGDKRTRWAYITHAHHHLVCRQCKAVVDFDDEAPFQQLADNLNLEHGVRVDLHHLVLRGLCPECAAAIAVANQ